MLTEADRLSQESSSIQERVDFNNEIILAAAKYERINENRDFLSVLGDLRGVKEVLDKEILVLSKQIVMSEDPRDRMTVQNEFLTKSIRRMVLEEAISYPARIINQATLAKEENIELKKRLKENSNAGNN